MTTTTIGSLSFAGDTLTLSAIADDTTSQVVLQVTKADGTLVAGENLSQAEMASQDPATYVTTKVADLNAKLAAAFPAPAPVAPPVTFVAAIMVFLQKLSLVVDAAGSPSVATA